MYHGTEHASVSLERIAAARRLVTSLADASADVVDEGDAWEHEEGEDPNVDAEEGSVIIHFDDSNGIVQNKMDTNSMRTARS